MPNVVDAPPLSDADLYEADFYAWTQAQAQKLRDHSANAIDWENLAEEIDSVGKSEKREIRNRLETLIMHLLKWEFQPEKRKDGWQASVKEQRRRIKMVVNDSPSLKLFPAAVADDAYELARYEAVKETDLPLSTFPEIRPYSIDQILDKEFLPGQPWSPHDLIGD